VPTTPNPYPDAPAAAAGTAPPPTVGRMAESAHKVVDELAGRAGPAVERLRSGVSGAVDSMGRTVHDLADSGDEWVESCRQTVREHPVAAIAAALAAGYLLARLTSDR
jgi:ElaB/YqjD/DUF883 family membrane-anchored ribosome-binding protein